MMWMIFYGLLVYIAVLTFGGVWFFLLFFLSVSFCLFSWKFESSAQRTFSRSFGYRGLTPPHLTVHNVVNIYYTVRIFIPHFSPSAPDSLANFQCNTHRSNTHTYTHTRTHTHTHTHTHT